MDWHRDGWRNIGKQTYFPQITTLNARACWAPKQYYGKFEWENGENGRIRLLSYRPYSSYEEFYEAVASFPNTFGESGTGLMIPSWRAMMAWYGAKPRLECTKIVTRRVISEEFRVEFQKLQEMIENTKNNKVVQSSEIINELASFQKLQLLKNFYSEKNVVFGVTEFRDLLAEAE